MLRKENYFNKFFLVTIFFYISKKINYESKV